MRTPIEGYFFGADSAAPEFPFMITDEDFTMLHSLNVKNSIKIKIKIALINGIGLAKWYLN